MQIEGLSEWEKKRKKKRRKLENMWKRAGLILRVDPAGWVCLVFAK